MSATELAKDFTLFQIEESLVLLAESAEEEGLTLEIERALTVYLEGAAETRQGGRLHPLLRGDGQVGQGRREEVASPTETLRSDSRAR